MSETATVNYRQQCFICNTQKTNRVRERDYIKTGRQIETDRETQAHIQKQKKNRDTDAQR